MLHAVFKFSKLLSFEKNKAVPIILEQQRALPRDPPATCAYVRDRSEGAFENLIIHLFICVWRIIN